jgi:hypothetical protein
MNNIELAIRNSNIETINTLWALLKYRELGILKKINCMAQVLGIDSDDFLRCMVSDEDGRVIDKASRKIIHDILIKYSI